CIWSSIALAMGSVVLDAKASLAEGPCWDEKKQLLYWVDIVEKQLCIFSPTVNTNRVIALLE
ncbi:SMP-30/gluconolactonase/LRE family protein, partial [Serratia marcescens]|uniref:SMP-30/gluconolactonase/LRE family protein n=1 Tax=Serratia marcescens TaxID=615 RepID=UPI001953725D